LKIPKGGNQTL